MLKALLVVSSHVRPMDGLARSLVSWLPSPRMQPHLMQRHLVPAHRRLIAVPMLYLEPVDGGGMVIDIVDPVSLLARWWLRQHLRSAVVGVGRDLDSSAGSAGTVTLADPCSTGR